MARFQLKFIDSLHDETNSEITIIEFDRSNFIQIIMYEGNEDYFRFNMDKSTAIKFAKTLRTEINKLTEMEAKDV